MKSLEDPPLLTGKGNFIDDIKMEGMLFCATVRSPYAKATIRKITRPNDSRLVDFIDGKELAKIAKPYSKFEMGDRKFEHYSLPLEKVHFVGEPVAAVLAKTRYEAEDLVELVDVEYENERAVSDCEEALDPKQKSIDSWPDNLAFQKTISYGDFETALVNSVHHFELETRIARQAAIPIETRGNVTMYNSPHARLLIFTPTKGPHTTRANAALVFSMQEHSLQVRVPEIGGGFGIKAYYYPEEVVAAAFAIRNKCAVKWISTRSEDLTSTLQARDQVHKTTICLDSELKITGFKDEFTIDIGTPGSLSFSPTSRMVPLLGGCYKIPNLLVSYKGVATNKPPMGPIRGNGRPEALLVTERAIEHAARKLGVDPVLIRKKNLIPPTEMPYDNHIGAKYDSGNYEQALNTVVEKSKYEELRVWKKKEFQERGRVIGIGLASYVEDTGGPPGKSGRPQYETAFMRVERDGTVSAFSGSSPHGQGHETTFSEIVANELGIELARIRIKFGDTSLIPYGVGSMGSRSGISGGSAMLLAAREIKGKMSLVAGALLGCGPENVQVANGKFTNLEGGKSLTFSEVALVAYEQRKETNRLAKGLSAEVYFEPEALTFAYGTVLAVVELDRESGRPSLLQMSVLDDSGHVIDHQIVEGQVQGGIAHGIGNALLEKIPYTKEGQPLATNLMDYLIPTSLDIPKLQLFSMETPSTSNPLGVKGAGEGGTIGALPVVVNAISDALEETITNVPINLEEIHNLLSKRTSITKELERMV